MAVGEGEAHVQAYNSIVGIVSMVQPGTVNTVSTVFTVSTVETLNNCGYYITVYYHSGRVANPIQSNRQSNPIDPYLDNRKSKVGQSIIRFTIQSK